MINEYNLAQSLDQTKLDPTATVAEYVAFFEEAAKYQLGTVAIMPILTKTAVDVLRGSKTKISAAISYPHGATPASLKTAEAKNAIGQGADEIDYVVNVGALRSGDYETLAEESHQMVDAVEGCVLKAIVESWCLSPREIRAIMEILCDAGVTFLKTSTGYKGFPSIQPTSHEDAKRLVEMADGRIFVKVSGGVRDAQTAVSLLDMGVARIGTSAGNKIIDEFRRGAG